jgi:ABC-type multidrug transport system ATPase subunit
VLVTSHNLGELESLAESVVFLLDGRARFDGTLEKLLRDTGRRTLEEAIAHLMLQRDTVPVEASLRSMEQKNLSPRLGVA